MYIRLPVDSKNKYFSKSSNPRTTRLRFVYKSDKLITISEFTKNDLIKKYAVDPNKIIVAHCAVDADKFKKIKLTSATRKKYRLPNTYLLYLGTIEPRKNIANLVRAYSKLPKNIKDQYPLVLAGGGGWNDDEIKQAIDLARQNSEIIQTGYIEEKDIPALYSGAELFLYPSHFEGFGMQILEAMACDTPVLTANNSSLPEVGGESAYYVDDKSIESIKYGIEKLLNEPKLRQDMIRKGRKQIKKFSWQESAQKIIDAINE